MPVQVSYPGVYVDEFAPGAPIEGVGTSTAAFIGTAACGPLEKPTLIQSWDGFKKKFGDILVEQPPSYLAPAVYGFFLNGGTACYVVRVGSGQNSAANLDSHQAGNKPILVARALAEGPQGNALTVQVQESSRLATMLEKIFPSKNAITGLSVDRRTITVRDIQGFSGGEVIALVKETDRATVLVAEPQGNDQLVLAGAVPGNVVFIGGEVISAGLLAVVRAGAKITTLDADRQTLTVDNLKGFAPGDRLLVKKAGEASQQALLKAIEGNDKLILETPLPGVVAFTDVRSDDLASGQRAFRVATPAALNLRQALPKGTALKFNLADPGTEEIVTVESVAGDTITIRDGLANTYSLENAAVPPTVGSLEFDLIIRDTSNPKKIVESFAQLSMNRAHPYFWQQVVASQLVSLEESADPPSPLPADLRPVAKLYNLADGAADDRNAAQGLIKGKPEQYLDLLKPYDEVALVCVPGFTGQNVQKAVIDHCETMWDRFGILDSEPKAGLDKGIRKQSDGLASEFGFAALYYPWIQVINPVTGGLELWPPSGHLAGVYARTDAREGVHKAPANTNIRGAVGLERLLTDAEQGPLNINYGVNALRVFRGQGTVVWGARTITTQDRNWQYVNIRRLLLFIEESIKEGIRWALFKPNNLQLWEKLKRSISDFLTRVWRSGALFGETADKAFYVRIDEALNPFAEQALGRLNIEVGVRPTYPAEFIILHIGIWEGGSEVTES
ncbi:MAG: phage tail sheath subtilisin-like domain-containing protein [Desulfobaccales bacterium]